jgi:hypothetical protein
MSDDVKDPWEEIRFTTMDSLVTFTKLHGSAFSMRGWTTPENWPFTVIVAIGGPGHEALPQALLDALASLSSVKAAIVNPASPTQAWHIAAYAARHENDSGWFDSSGRFIGTDAAREAAREASRAEKPTPPLRTSCNRHDNCDAADAEARARHGRAADHCHDECCEDCFGQ